MSFSLGDLVVIEDHKRRRSLVTLTAEAKINTHVGAVAVGDIIGQDSGSLVLTSTDRRVFVLEPTFEDFVFHMPRGAQVIYPKDIGAIMMRLNLRSGDRVLESGVGSGAMSIAMLKAGVSVVGVEAREDFMNLARKNVASFLGEQYLGRYTVQLGDAYDRVPDGPFDAVMLDLPEPWRALKVVRKVVRPGGVLAVYVTNVTQLQRVVAELGDADFGYADAIELLEREWYLKGLIARPHHRMVGHTGFILTARPLQRRRGEIDEMGDGGIDEPSLELREDNPTDL
ncbi:MAG: tRNA (adenine-N1)-methyltransferase [Acidimicrobiales bacterium]